MIARKRKRCPINARRGIAAVEFAVVSPMFVLILLGTIEACSMVFLRQSVELSSYEATRVAIVKNTTEAQVKQAAKNVLDARKVKDYSITITPANFQEAAYGTFIQVEVKVPCSSNSLIPAMFYSGKDMVGLVEMMKEY